MKHLSLDKLPPIADFDDAENLMKRSLHVCHAHPTGDLKLNEESTTGTRSSSNKDKATPGLQTVEGVAYAALCSLRCMCSNHRVIGLQWLQMAFPLAGGVRRPRFVSISVSSLNLVYRQPSSSWLPLAFDTSWSEYRRSKTIYL